jgi:ABC-type branched-subunit amino acid transport system substrate-binding protein
MPIFPCSQKNISLCDRFIKKQTLVNGSTGNVAFDDNGDRINAEYDIINVQNQTQISVGQYHYSNVCIHDKFFNYTHMF